jgi:hypothetical protein
VEYHGGGTVTAEDVVATLKRHTDEKSQSGALGIVQGITEMKAEGDMVTLKLTAANADLPYPDGRLSPDHPARWRRRQSGSGHRRRGLQGRGQRTGRAHHLQEALPTIGTRPSAMPTRSRF